MAARCLDTQPQGKSIVTLSIQCFILFYRHSVHASTTIRYRPESADDGRVTYLGTYPIQAIFPSVLFPHAL
jgi:hypothetical protein